jgi:GNAT superfamily N-acetyltransferase
VPFGRLPWLFRPTFAGRAFAHRSAFCTQDYQGAALWLPPGVESDDAAVEAVLQSTVRPETRDDLYAMLEQMGQFHPIEPHWYLPLIGVDPAAQGRGYGALLMKGILDQCDAQALPAYLEATSPRNVPLYQRHGFEVVGTIQIGTSPPLVPMYRKPR